MTDAQFIAWLGQLVRRPCVLVEVVARVGGVETTRYLASEPYTTGPAETPANQYYSPRIIGGCKIIERLSLDGSGAGMSFGDIELANIDGALDGWLADVWANRSLRMYVGDLSWPRADFRLVFDGITADIGASSRDSLNIKARDKLQRLNSAISENKLGGTSVNADRLLPIVLGEVHNIEPLLTDKATLEYQVHSGTAERIIEVRDNGVVVASSDTLATGKFTLLASPAGTVTASVQGAKFAGSYVNTVAKLIELLATGYGADPLTGADLDAANLAAFDAANQQPVGRPLMERENVLAICQELAASVGAQVVMSATGLLQLLRVDLAGMAPTPVSARNMDVDSLELRQRLPVQPAVKLGYCRNWTVQTNLQTGIPPEHSDLFAQEWLTSTVSDAAVAAAYKLTQEPVQQDTLLQVKADADAEAARRLALWSVQRAVYSYDGYPALMLQALGGYQTVTAPRFGMAAGKAAQIVGVERDWLGLRVTIEALV